MDVFFSLPLIVLWSKILKKSLLFHVALICSPCYYTSVSCLGFRKMYLFIFDTDGIQMFKHTIKPSIHFLSWLKVFAVRSHFIWWLNMVTIFILCTVFACLNVQFGCAQAVNSKLTGLGSREQDHWGCCAFDSQEMTKPLQVNLYVLSSQILQVGFMPSF